MKIRLIGFRTFKKHCEHRYDDKVTGCCHEKNSKAFDVGRCCEKRCPVFKRLALPVKVADYV